MSRFLAAATFGAAGFLGATSAVSAEGTDLRAERQTDVADLARAQVQRNRALDADRSELREEVNGLLNSELGGGNADRAQKEAEELAPAAGLTALSGPGVSVTLDDAPVSSRAKDVDPDALVVHQQDIQGVVNALWAGGAEAMTLQGQRIISTSAVRCVGNTVRINGWVYSPPYHIEAIGDAEGMVEALGESPEVDIYRDYAAKYDLGWSLKNTSDIHVPAFDGPLNLDYAEERTEGKSPDR
jgi:uncharacterized protein YlxW (UPF0749 family)